MHLRHVAKSKLCSTHSPYLVAWNLERKYTYSPNLFHISMDHALYHQTADLFLIFCQMKPLTSSHQAHSRQNFTFSQKTSFWPFLKICPKLPKSLALPCLKQHLNSLVNLFQPFFLSCNQAKTLLLHEAPLMAEFV